MSRFTILQVCTLIQRWEKDARRQLPLVNSLVQNKGFYADPTPPPSALERLLAAFMFFLPLVQHIQALVEVAIANLQRGLLQAMVEVHHMGMQSGVELKALSSSRISDIHATLVAYYDQVAGVQQALHAWQYEPLIHIAAGNDLVARSLPPLSGSLLRLAATTVLCTLAAWLAVDLPKLRGKLDSNEAAEEHAIKHAHGQQCLPKAHTHATHGCSSSQKQQQQQQARSQQGGVAATALKVTGRAPHGTTSCQATWEHSGSSTSDGCAGQRVLLPRVPRVLTGPATLLRAVLVAVQVLQRTCSNTLRHVAGWSSRPELVIAAYSTALSLTIVRAPLIPTPPGGSVGWYAHVATWLAISSVALILYWSARCVAVSGPRVLDFAQAMVRMGGQLCIAHMLLVAVDLVVTMVAHVEVADKVQYCLAYAMAAALIATFHTLATEQLAFRGSGASPTGGRKA